MHSLLLQGAPLLLLATPAFSWGNLGHRTVGYLSQMYMTPQGLDYFNNIIQPTDSFDISDAAIWADSHKIGAYAYTYNWHFIDARDDPPTKCQVVFKRDCDTRDKCDTKKAPGCVVGAIVNQTARVAAGDTAAESMKFLLHFVGDAHQPLHVENLARGGNDICVEWSKRHHSSSSHAHAHVSRSNVDVDAPPSGCPTHPRCNVNLHEVWDTLAIEKLIGYNSHGAEAEKDASKQWAQQLHDSTDGSINMDDCVPTGNDDNAINCALSWAAESNDYVCSYVLKDGVDGVEGVDLSGAYYEGAVPIIQSRITNAAKRFAAIVNTLAASGSSGSHNQVVMNEL